MPTPTKGPRLGGSPSHERLMLANLATALFEHDRITTTEAKAKRLRPLAEKLITFAKRGDLHARRRVMTVIRDKDVVHKLFAEIGPNYTERGGGYTRIVKVGPRKGDNAPMAIIELVEAVTAAQSVVAEGQRARGTKVAPRRAPRGRTREIAEDASAESTTAAAVAADGVEDDDTTAPAGATAFSGATGSTGATASSGASEADIDPDLDAVPDDVDPDADIADEDAVNGPDTDSEPGAQDRPAAVGLADDESVDGEPAGYDASVAEDAPARDTDK